MKAICKSCNIDFVVGKKPTQTCPSCGQAYNMQSKNNNFSVKFLNGYLEENLSESDIKSGILNGKYLSVDFISNEEIPWIKFKDSDFRKLFKSTTVITESGASSGRTWVLLFWLSFVVNILLLGLIWFQKGQIDKFIK